MQSKGVCMLNWYMIQILIGFCAKRGDSEGYHDTRERFVTSLERQTIKLRNTVMRVWIFFGQVRFDLPNKKLLE